MAHQDMHWLSVGREVVEEASRGHCKHVHSEVLHGRHQQGVICVPRYLVYTRWRELAATLSG